jgi:acetyltransferase
VPQKKKKSRLDALFRPQSVAVIGASRREGSIGREILHAIVEGGFSGKVFPVNPNTEVVHSIKCYDNVGAVPDPVESRSRSCPRRSSSAPRRASARS